MMLSQVPEDKSASLIPQKQSSLNTLSDIDTPYSDSNSMRKTGKWTPEEDELLRKYAPIYGERQWRKISDKIPGRTSIQCLHRWTKILKPGLVKGPWTPEEDQKLITWVKENGPNKWALAAKLIHGRSGKQCRERWFNNLSPDVKKGDWTKEEDEMIFRLYDQYGSSWSQLAKLIPGRTENAIKNRFYSTLRRLATIKKRRHGTTTSLKDKSFMSDRDQVKEEGAMSFEYPDKKEIEPHSGDQILEEKIGGKDFGYSFNNYPSLQESTSHHIYSDSSVLRVKPDNIPDKPRGEITLNHNLMKGFDDIHREDTPGLRLSSENSLKLSLEENDKEFENFLALKGFDPLSPIHSMNSRPKVDDKPMEVVIDSHLDDIHHNIVNYSNQGAKKPCESPLYGGLYQTPTKPVKVLQQSNGYPHGDMDDKMKNSVSTSFYTPNKTSPIQAKGFGFHPENFDNGGLATRQSSADTLSSPPNAKSAFYGEKPYNAALIVSNKILELCLSQRVNGIDRVNNLIFLLKSFLEQSSMIPGMNNQPIVLNNGQKDQLVDKKAIKELVTNMNKAVNCVATVHYNYVRYLLGIVKDLPKGNVEEFNKKMDYLFSQLSNLERLLVNVRGQIHKMETSFLLRGGLNENDDIKLEDSMQMGANQIDKEGMKKTGITIRIGSLNSGLEEISKKRILG